MEDTFACLIACPSLDAIFSNKTTLKRQKLSSNGIFKKGPFPASFSLFSPFNAVDINVQYKFNFADDWIRTVVLWSQKRQLYQLPHLSSILFSEIV